MTTQLNEAARKQSRWWLPGLLALACLVWAYWPTIEGMSRQWLNNEDYSHGILVAPIVAYLAWRKREELSRAKIGADWRALPVLLLAVIVFIVGELGAELFTTRLSIIVFAIGLTWLLYGAEVVKIVAFPLGFLFLMLPLPGFIYRNVTFPLQMLASIGSVNVLHSVGISALREGNVIDIGVMKLQVVEACSGLRYILPFLTLGVLFSYFGQKLLWKRLVLTAATIPISVAANVLRVSGTGFIGMYWGNEAAEGFFHSFSGWAVFMVSIVFFVFLNLLLKYLPGKAEKKEPHAPTGPAPRYHLPWVAVGVAAVIVVATPTLVNSLGQVAPLPLSRPLSEFPLDFQGWSGQKTAMDPKIWEKVGGQEYVIINYAKEKQTPLNFYVVYYEYQRKGGDFVHSPRLCLPGEGWYIEKNHVRTLQSSAHGKAGHRHLELNELLIQRGNDRNLVYFWYQGRGRNFTNEFAAKFYMVWDGLWRRRTDGALVRLITPLTPGEGPDQARKVMDSFALAAFSTLEDHLP